MKRDMELVREILRRVEDHQQAMGWVPLDIPGHSREEVSYHVMLLAQAGLLEATDLVSTAGFLYEAKRLTWAGHEFLDAIRNDTVWNKVKETVKEKGGAIPLEMGVVAPFGRNKGKRRRRERFGSLG
jgi:hypothetical protein